MDWNTPTASSAYVDVLDNLKSRDFDAASHFYTALPTNPQTGMLAFIRASSKWQEYNGASWADKLLAIAGGGTGAATATNARTNLGLGTIAVQDANNVAITGGSITGVSADASIITAGNLNPARMPVGGSWATLTSKLLFTGHAVQLAGIGIGYRTGGATTLTDTDGLYVCTGGAVNLPSAIGFVNRILGVKRNGTAVTFTTTSSQTIDGSAPASLIALGQLETIWFQSNGANWNIAFRGTASVVAHYTGNVPAYTASGETYVDVTITAVDRTRSYIVPLGPDQVYLGVSLGNIPTQLYFTSDTNVRFTWRNGTTAIDSGTVIQPFYFSVVTI